MSALRSGTRAAASPWPDPVAGGRSIIIVASSDGPPSVDEVPLLASPQAALGAELRSSPSRSTHGDARLRFVMALIMVNSLWILATADRLFGGEVRPVRGIGR